MEGQLPLINILLYIISVIRIVSELRIVESLYGPELLHLRILKMAPLFRSLVLVILLDQILNFDVEVVVVGLQIRLISLALEFLLPSVK